ncbi:Enzyme that catalyzes the fourth step in the histidine pathway [Oleoguttula sp. CCFEE 5521]
MTKFRPCIDIHAGHVKQIVGGSLTTTATDLQTNFTSEHPASYYASLYQKHNLTGGHVIKLGPGNDEAAREALSTWRDGLQVGGGITNANAKEWVEAGAEKVIITSFLFPDGKFSLSRLESVLKALGGDKEKLVVDLSCRKVGDGWMVAMDRWQTVTGFGITQENIKLLEPYCSEFLIHAADVEGKQAGIDEALVSHLAAICSIPVTYAGGGRNLEDLELVKRLSNGKIDLTIGSALDIFGGKGVTFEECCKWNEKQ